MFTGCKFTVFHIRNPSLEELHDILEGMACLCATDVVLTIYFRITIKSIGNTLWLVPSGAPDSLTEDNVSYECMSVDNIHENISIGKKTLCIFIFHPVESIAGLSKAELVQELIPSSGYCILAPDCRESETSEQELIQVLSKHHKTFSDVLAMFSPAFKTRSLCPSSMPPFFFNTHNAYCKSVGLDLIQLLTTEVGRHEPETRKMLAKYLYR
eukprot:TRINITY_DN28305_c0_g1_i1.p1 TRINITY_DN28305_c0_g1~~TRINITY_DN28305_c0_g1_i1.p1  ORF type:complete len:220 (+),score=23.58 TRINITY_DN28305_c0_g1_i1:26-661(+)